MPVNALALEHIVRLIKPLVMKGLWVKPAPKHGIAMPGRPGCFIILPCDLL